MKPSMYRIYCRDKQEEYLKSWKLQAAFVWEDDARAFIRLLLLNHSHDRKSPDHELKLTHYCPKRKKTMVLKRYKGGRVE